VSYLGIDLGTSSVKLLLMDEAQKLVASADASLSLQQPLPLWSEQQPANWWAALEQAAHTLRQQVPAVWSAVKAVGLSGQMHGAVLLDAQGEVLRPAILWNDGRSAVQCTWLEAHVARSRQITGNLAMPGFTAPKLLWVRRHEPEIFARVARVLLPKDWLRLQLTGQAVSEMSDASGTLWLDVARRAWSGEMLAACGLNEAQMPRLVEGSQVSAVVRPSWVQRWGWQGEVVVAGGAGDNAASAVGIGAVAPGQGFVSLGTSGVIFRVSERFMPAPEHAVHAFAHALPGLWHQMSVMLSAAGALSWLSRLSGVSVAVLSQQVEALPPDRRAQAPLFKPYLQGERTPHNNPMLRASFTNLQSAHELPDLAYAVMEGVAFGLLDGWHAMGYHGPSSTPLTLVGGGARSKAWAQLIASALQCPLQQSSDAPVAAALGAARLAWMAHTGQGPESLRSSPPTGEVQPLAVDEGVLAERYGRFCAPTPFNSP
jgi:xylulokinase